MERKEFLKRLGLSALVTPVIIGCQEDKVEPTTDPSTNSSTTIDDGTCSVTPSETAGPFPTKDPSSFVMQDITSDRTGIALAVTLTIQNSSNSCEPLKDAIVDIWHCDKDGYYSEYGGTGMQSANFTSVHFLRGRQAVVIYPAHGRGTSVSPGRKCRHTLDGNNEYPHDRAFAGLNTFNDQMLGPGHANTITLTSGGIVLIVPLEGALEMEINHNKSSVDVGAVALLTTDSVCAVTLRNLYLSSWVNYLEIGINAVADSTGEGNPNHPGHVNPAFFTFDLSDKANLIVSLNITENITLHFGRYLGRVDGAMKIQDASNLLAFVIDGICEMNDRLLETRDALALTHPGQISFESLSPESVIMMIQGI